MNSELKSRLKTDIFLNNLKDGEEMCTDEATQLLNNELLIIKRIGSDSINGEAYSSCTSYTSDESNSGKYKCKQDSTIVSIKKIPLSQYEKEIYFMRDETEELLGLDVFAELKALQLCKYILTNKEPICPNLPLYYKYLICNDCNYTNKAINNRNLKNVENAIKKIKIRDPIILSKLANEKTNVVDYLTKKLNKLGIDYINPYSPKLELLDYLKDFLKKPEDLLTFIDTFNNNVSRSCILLINEFASEGDLKNWLKTDRSVMEWCAMYFQVFAGLYTLQKHFNMTHHDLHWGNVLVHKIKPGGFLHYKIDDTYYKIPNIGYLFTLWDFGYAHIPNLLEAKSKNFYSKIFKESTKYCEDYYRISHAIHWNIKKDKVTGLKNGKTPAEMGIFFNKITELFENKITLCYVFKVMFSDFINNNPLKDDYVYKIDKETKPDIPIENKYFYNKNKYYMLNKSYILSDSNSNDNNTSDYNSLSNNNHNSEYDISEYDNSEYDNSESLIDKIKNKELEKEIANLNI